MCGFAGIFKTTDWVEPQRLIDAISTLHHRGPDDRGVWVEERLGLAHARLSIHDLSSAGHQPMLSASKRWVITYNGEIYNFADIKIDLLTKNNISFKSNSDTEILITAIENWGIEQTLLKCRGMFAFAAWDRQDKKLYLARDRFGEKPLYYGKIKNDFVFASELKAIHINYRSDLEIDRDALANFMRLTYLPAPHSIYKNIFKLDAGSFLVIDKHMNVYKKKYWHHFDVAQEINTFSGSYHEAADILEEKLKETISLQIQSDVPVGAFLSGGIDSSTIVSLMQIIAKRKIKTFSLGFENKNFNEADYAKRVAEYIGTDHTEMYVTEEAIFPVIQQLPFIYDEPFADPSQIPTYLVSKLAREQVTVSLTGDGGDELFGGYNHYAFANTIKKSILDKRFIHFALHNTPPHLLKIIRLLSQKWSDKLLKLQDIIHWSKGSHYDLYFNLCSHLHHPNDLVLKSNEYTIYKERNLYPEFPLAYMAWMMFVDCNLYLIDNILAKVDRAAMAVSLETRIPFLDHHIYEFVWSLPMEFKVNEGVSKRILKDILYRHVPKKLIERPKRGFGIPLNQWLKSKTLNDWATHLLDPITLKQQGFLNPNLVQRYWHEHQTGKKNWQHILWNILMFQAWLMSH